MVYDIIYAAIYNANIGPFFVKTKKGTENNCMTNYSYWNVQNFSYSRMQNSKPKIYFYNY